MFKKGDYLTCNGEGHVDTGLIIELLSAIDKSGEATIMVRQVGLCDILNIGFKKEGYRVIGGCVRFRLATEKEIIDSGILAPVEQIPSSQIQFQSKTCGGTTFLQRMMHRIIELRKYYEKPRLTVMVMQGEKQQEVVNRVKKDVALLRKYTGYSSFITVRKEK